MPQPIANNILTPPISGSIERGAMSLAIEGQDRDYGNNYSGLDWYSSITPLDGKYVIISKSSGTGLPTHWVTADDTDAELLYTVNRLPAVANNLTFTDTGSALDYLATSDRYIVLRSMPNNSDADGLLLSMDGNILSSYPRTNTTVYDISGNTTNGTLTNGPTFNSNGYWDFDGTNDYLSLGSSAASLVQGKTAVSMGILFKMDSLASLRGLIGTLVYNCGKNLGLVASGNTLSFYNDYSSTCYDVQIGSIIETGKWIFAVGTYDGTTTRLYSIKDGTLNQNSGTSKTGATNVFSSDFRIMGNQYSSYFTDGQGAKAFVYDRVLSESDILQNYFGGPIVTDSLTFNFDAGNLVSYENGSTITYNMTGSESGTLTNGTSYSNSNGGIWEFDGVDDFINLGYQTFNFDPSTTNFSTGGWIWINAHKTYNTLIQLGGTGAAHNFLGGNSSGYIEYRTRPASGTSVQQVVSTGPVSTNQWYHIFVVCDTTNAYLYINGELNNTGTLSGMPTTTYDQSIGFYRDSALYLNGKVGPVQLYIGKALTAEEIGQNYNASKQKYQL